MSKPLDRRLAVSAALLSALAVWAAFTPLFGLLGYEFSATIALCASFAAAWHGARTRAAGTALLHAYLMLLPPLALITLNALRVRNCDYLAGLAFYALLPGLSVVCGVALGRLCARLVRRPVLLASGLILASLAWSLVRFYRTPAIFSFDPFLGYFPGALYDEDLTIPPSLLWARAMHLAFALTVLLGTTRRMRAALPALAVGCLLFALRGRLAIAPDAKDIARALGGERTTEHFTLIYARGSAAEKDIERIAVDHEFRYAQLHDTLGTTPIGNRVTSFLFSSAADKRKWMGAANTFIAKPWRREIYLQTEPFPHPVLKHELAHVFAGAFGDPLFGASVRYWPPRINMGLIEGLAVAAAWRGGGELSSTGYARALDQLGMMPPLEALFGVRFFGISAPRAYTVAGAFCRYLLETYGPERLRAVYRSAGDFVSAYGKDLGTLEREWRAQLASVTLQQRELEVAREQLRRPAIWRKVCAHALAALSEEADRARDAGNYAEATRCLDRIIDDDPDEPQHLVTLAELRAQALDLAGALAVVHRALDHKNTSKPLRAYLYDLEGDLRWRTGDPAAARASWRRVLELPTDESRQRTAWAKLIMAADARLREPLSRLFFGDATGRHDAALGLYFAERARLAAPDASLPVYLLGRGLFLREAYTEAIGELRRAREMGLEEAALDREALRMLALSTYHAKGADRAPFEELIARKDVTQGVRIEARDYLERMAWERLILQNAPRQVPLPAP